MSIITRDGERWTQPEIEEIETAKEEQRRREQEVNLQRDANSQSRQVQTTQ